MAKTAATRPDETETDTTLPSRHPLAREVSAFRAGRAPEDRTVDLLAFALAAEQGGHAAAADMHELRQEAQTLLSDYSFRYLHNSVDQIRREAAAEQLAKLPRPLGFGMALLANLIALLLFAAAAGWLALHPETLSGLAGAIAG